MTKTEAGRWIDLRELPENTSRSNRDNRDRGSNEIDVSDLHSKKVNSQINSADDEIQTRGRQSAFDGSEEGQTIPPTISSRRWAAMEIPGLRSPERFRDSGSCIEISLTFHWNVPSPWVWRLIAFFEFYFQHFTGIGVFFRRLGVPKAVFGRMICTIFLQTRPTHEDESSPLARRDFRSNRSESMGPWYQSIFPRILAWVHDVRPSQITIPSSCENWGCQSDQTW
jgi:hypothetical protein